MITIEGRNIEMFVLNEKGLVEVIDIDNNCVYEGLLLECVHEMTEHDYKCIKLYSYTVEKLSKGHREKKIIKKILSKIDEDEDLCICEDIDNCVNYVYNELESYNLLKDYEN